MSFMLMVMFDKSVCTPVFVSLLLYIIKNNDAEKNQVFFNKNLLNCSHLPCQGVNSV